MSKIEIPIKHSRVQLTRLEDENPQWIKIFEDLPDWRVFLIKEGNIYPSRHLEREVVFLEEIRNDVRDSNNNNYSKRKRKKVEDPFKVFISPSTRKCQRLRRKKQRPRNLRQFNGTENLFVERRLEDYTAEWVKEKSKLGRLNYLKRKRKSLMENEHDSSSSSSPATTASTPENDENRDPKNIEEEHREQLTMDAISSFQRRQHLQNQQRIAMSRALQMSRDLQMSNVLQISNLNALSSRINSESSIMGLEDISIIEDQDKDQGNVLNDLISFFDNNCNYDNSIYTGNVLNDLFSFIDYNGNYDYSIYTDTDFDLLLFDPVEERETLESIFLCYESCCTFFNQSNHFD